MEHSGPWPAGTPCWVDLTVSDLSRSQEFYRRVLGWSFTEPEPDFGNYCNALVGGQVVAGMAPPMPGTEPTEYRWTTYLATDDLDATHARALELGASEMAPPMDLSPLGRMAVWADPTGASFGGWESGQHTGFGVIEDPGSPAWLDMATSDVDTAERFYGDLFGYAYEAEESYPAGRYVMFTPPGADRPAGGIGTLDPSATWPEGWNVAFSVADVDAALASVREAGGTVLGEPEEDEHGRMAPVKGPDGEVFTLFLGKPM